MNSFSKSLMAASIGLGILSNAGAAIIGAGAGILTADGANNVFDTPSDGTTDQSRVNIDDSFTSTLTPGVYQATSWSFQAGQTGSVIPVIAEQTSPDVFSILGFGSRIDIGAGDLDQDLTFAFGGSNTFTLGADTEIFAGIINPPEAGMQNPVYTNLASGFTVDHNNNGEGDILIPEVGGAIDGLNHANLGRSYAFSIDVSAIPEPSSALLSLVCLGGLLVFRRSR